MKNTFISNTFLLLVALFSTTYVEAFSTNPVCVTSPRLSSALYAETATGADPQEIIGKTIKVKGDVNGGYVRTCIKNEVGRFVLRALELQVKGVDLVEVICLKFLPFFICILSNA